MFFISLPLSVKVGDTVDCKVNGEPRKITYRDTGTLVIEPGDARSIVDVRADASLRYFTCGDSEADGGTTGIEVIG